MNWPCLKPVAAGVELRVFVQPRTSRDQVVGLHGDELKVALTAPPVDGAANKACCQFLAKLVGIPRRQVRLLAGEASRHKRLLLEGAAAEAVGRTLDGLGLDISGSSH